MRAQVLWAFLLLCLCIGQSAAAAQKTPAQRTIAVVVLDGHAQPPQPVPTVRVELNYLDGSVRISESREVTNPRGQAWLELSEDAAQRGGLHIEIDGAKDLVIYQPADGQLAALPATITVSMLPKGSPALLGPAGIQAMLRRMSIEISTLQKKNAALAGQANAAQSSAAQAQKPDLGAAVAEWAQANGFSAADANKQVQQWAEGIQKQSGEATAEQKALAELALNHYANAAQLFNEAGDADRRQIDTEEAQEKALQAQMQALQAAQQALLEKLRTPMRELLDHSQQAAGAYRLNGQYHEATQTLESAATAIDAQSNKFPDDKGFHELWLEAFAAAASARSREGTVAPARESLALLEKSASDYRSLVSKYAVLGDRQEEAGAQVGLGIVLEEEGVRVSGDKSAALLDQAVQAFRERSRGANQSRSAQDWAKHARRSRGCALRRGSADQRRQGRWPARSGGRGVSQRARGLHQSRSAPGMGQDAKESRGPRSKARETTRRPETKPPS